MMGLIGQSENMPNSFGKRIKLLQFGLDGRRLDGFLVLTKLNRQYVSGFTGSAGVVLVGKSGASLYVDDRYLIRAKRESGLRVLPLSTLATSPALRASSPRQGRKIMKIAIEDRITLRELKWLRKLAKAQFVPTRDVIENLRAVKTDAEINSIKKAQRIVDEIFRQIKKFVKVGQTEAAVALEMERLAKKLGAQGMAFDSIVAFAGNAAAPHHLSGNRKIGNRNYLLLDFGVLINGYHSDFTRTLFIGRPSKKQELIYNTVREAQERTIAKIVPGEKAALIDQAARGHIQRAGFGKQFTHNTGHGVGLEIHELPNFSPTSEDVLRASMVVTVEPGIYIDNWGGVRIEDMVLVGRGGPVVLSKSPRDLKSMIIR